jgi:hypothetical protein
VNGAREHVGDGSGCNPLQDRDWPIQNRWSIVVCNIKCVVDGRYGSGLDCGGSALRKPQVPVEDQADVRTRGWLEQIIACSTEKILW